MVLVGLVLKDTAALVVVPEVVPEAGLRYCMVLCAFRKTKVNC